MPSLDLFSPSLAFALRSRIAIVLPICRNKHQAKTLAPLIALVQGLRPPVVQSYEVRLAGLPAERDGTVVIALSDLHLGSLDDIDAANPQAIASGSIVIHSSK